MTLSSREIIASGILDAIRESGSVGLHIPDTGTHPRKYLFVRDGKQRSLWVYCWSLTPGGRPSLPNEFRIQMTSVQSPLQLNPEGYTVLIGYEADRGVFAGYDISRHFTFTSGSPSVQVDQSTLNKALQDGLAFQEKANGDIVVGIRSDLLVFYCENAKKLHSIGVDSGYLDIVGRAAKSEDIPGSELLSLSQERQIVVRETAHWSRSSSFKKQVLTAYENRCAVTRRQLKLVDAAHILPVKAGPDSIDHIRNGIALSPTYHRAFDNGLIYLDEQLVMQLNGTALEQLRQSGLDAGIDGFAAHLGKVHLPYAAELRPDPHFIRLANKFRGL